MDYEYFLSRCYTPMKAIEILSDIIYYKCNDEWEIFSGTMTREKGEELLALNYTIKLCAKHLLKIRKEEVQSVFK